jgi:ubiquinone/menaquinone biosynthesis C-methylase UbiE
MASLNFIQELHNKTRRDYKQRVIEFDKAECAGIAKKFGYDYWDGERKFGYGGYNYDGRWSKIAEKLVSKFGLNPNDKVLDIGCGKGYLLYEFKQLLPEITTVGIDISDYAIATAKKEVASDIILANASRLPFNDNEFDAVVSLGALHNLPLEQLICAIKEIVRVSKSDNNYLVVESWRNEIERVNMLYWQLTCEAFFFSQNMGMVI